MRNLERIADNCLFGHSVRDIDIRRELQSPSIDCILMKARLRYFGRILKMQPPALLALLSSRPGGSPIGWVRLIVQDMRILQQRVSLCSALPDPVGNPKPWLILIRDNPQRWSLAIGALYFVESICDRVAFPKANAAVLQHVCEICNTSFATTKALQLHARTKHEIRIPQRFC